MILSGQTKDAMPTKKKTSRIQLRCSEDWKDTVESVATREDRDISDLIRAAVNSYIYVRHAQREPVSVPMRP